VTALLPVRLVEKPWGRDMLPAPFITPSGKRIGEIWFEPPPAMPELLAKFIFTSQKLSVQVHPSDEQTISAGSGRQGKEECWLVIDAEPGATLGIGFNESLNKSAMRVAAQDGSIEQLLAWHRVAAGDFFYIPANTVHAIGSGVSLIEVQQNSDITYRLFDYGRPRELHLEQGLAVALGQPYDTALHRKVPAGVSMSLVNGPLFRLDQLCCGPDPAVKQRYGRAPLMVLPRAGTVHVGETEVAAGSCAISHSIESIDIPEGATCLIAQPCHATPVAKLRW
jgi:mannose-6-phosphate isomerase